VPPLLAVDTLCKEFPLAAGAWQGHGVVLRAVHQVSFHINHGETLALVGESGCGKSTVGRLVLRLLDPTAGRIELEGADIAHARGRSLRELRRRMQIVFQDPLGALNPRITVGHSIMEPLVVQGVPKAQRLARLAELLAEVELPPETAQRYPHEFSGGQRQRIVIARALALKPSLIVADEPVSALDASIQSQILMLFKRLQQEHGLAYLFISHDLAVVRFLAHRIAVMYLGEIVELASAAELFADPRHPYTQALLAAIPRPEPDAPAVQPLAGTVPSAAAPPPGCPFHTRCPQAQARCASEPPPKICVNNEHHVCCWLAVRHNVMSQA
jgi:oligopeptide transport system ATP-binding protein